MSMTKENKHRLTDTEVEQVRQAMQNPLARVAKRATVLYSLHLGYAPTVLAEMHDIDVASIYNYYHRFKREGIAGLPDKPRSGRPPKADATYRQLLEETLATDPQELGFGFGIWTLPRLCEYMSDKTGIILSSKHLGRVMEELDYVYRRPKKDPMQLADPALRDEFEQRLEVVKKAPQQVKLSYSLWTKVVAT
jgi:transposase